MKAPEILAALTPVAEALEHLGVAYHVGGSIASSAHGIARATLDVDVVAEIRAEDVSAFVQSLAGAYYVDEASIRDAVVRKSCFNLVHLESMVKVDIFIPPDRIFDREVQRRVHQERLDDHPDARRFPVKSAEDVVLAKLEWYSKGGGTSEKQWNDILGVLRVQRTGVDVGSLRRWARDLSISELLERALLEAGLPL